MVKQNKGFTLIELLIIIGIIGFLAAAILVAVDPVRRIQEARNSRRWSEVNALLNAYLNKQVDDKEYYWGNATTNPTTGAVTGAIVLADATKGQVIVSSLGTINCSAPATSPSCGAITLQATEPAGGYAAGHYACVADLSTLAPDYISALPHDPYGDGHDFTPGTTDIAIGATNTGYFVHRTATGRVEIGSCYPELAGGVTAPNIKVMR